MASEWHRGVLEKSSWHGLEEVGVMTDAVEMIEAGERSGAWPVALRSESIVTSTGLVAPGSAIVAQYRNAPDACLSVVGGRYRATTPDEWRDLVRAATAAGARPTGAFSLRDGTRSLATFEVGVANGLRTQLLIADSFVGSLGLTCGTTSVRVVCANTLSSSLSQDGKGMAKFRHTASLETKINVLSESIGEAITKGEKIRAVYQRAEQLRPTRSQAQVIFDALFPDAPDGSPKSTKTMAENARRDAMTAAALSVNNVGDSVATLWNAATYLVDRNANGSTRQVRSGDALDSMLFGCRSKRIEEIQTIIEVVMRDGSIREMTAPQAVESGVDSRMVAKKILEEMLA